MNFLLLETVVLERDLPEYALRRGDLGTIVELYEPDGVDVEFVLASGQTQALVELTLKDVRPTRARDIIAVRDLDQTG